MTPLEMNTGEWLESLGVAPTDAGVLGSALQMLALVDVAQVQRAIETIGHAESFGPFIDPTGFVTGRLRFEHGRRNRELLAAVAKLIEVIDAQLTPAQRAMKGLPEAEVAT